MPELALAFFISKKTLKGALLAFFTSY